MSLRISLVINTLFIVFFFWYFVIHIGLDVYYHKYISPKEDFLSDIYYQAKVNVFAELNTQLKADKEYVVFLGDSLIEQFPVNEFYPEKEILNRGIGYDTSEGILRRLESNIKNIHISKLFLMVGHNDLKYRSVEETSVKIQQILSEISSGQKAFISILPSQDQNQNRSVVLLNEKLKIFCYKNQIQFIDCYPQFIEKNGKIKSQFFFDGVHLNIKGYLLLKQLIH